MNIKSPAAHPTGRGRALRAWVHHFAHHLQLALIVASVISLLHAAHLLGWLDAGLLRLAAAVQGERRPVATAPAQTAAARPLVFTISQELYETAFVQTSPLDRQKLATLLGTIPGADAGGPKLLVVDIDLSPMAGADDERQAGLDAELRRLAGAGTRIVLPVPFRSRSAQLIAAKAAWMAGMCGIGHAADSSSRKVTFAFSEALTNMGQALQYDVDHPTLGMVASQIDAARSHRICDIVLASGKDVDQRNALLSSAYAESALAAFVDDKSRHEWRPFNPAFLQTVIDESAHWQTLDALPVGADGEPYKLVGRVLFLGGSFDRADQFDAPLSGGLVPGVFIHALVYASEIRDGTRRGVQTYHGNPPYFVDIGIGIVCAYLFQLLQLTHRRFAAWAEQQGDLKAYLSSRCSWLANLIVLAALLVASTAMVVHWLYPRQIWVDVGPVLIGIGAKYVLSSIAAGTPDADHAHAASPPRLHVALDWGLTLALVAVTLWVNHNLYSH